MKTVMVAMAALALWTAPAWTEAGGSPAQEVVALERQAMDGWLTGNPDPMLALCDPQITWFHAVLEKRLEGIEALRELYAGFRGRPLFDSYEMRDPKVQVAGDVAVLTYQLAQHNGALTTLWNGTQVYQKKKEGWRVIHTHWSATKTAQP